MTRPRATKQVIDKAALELLEQAPFDDVVVVLYQFLRLIGFDRFTDVKRFIGTKAFSPKQQRLARKLLASMEKVTGKKIARFDALAIRSTARLLSDILDHLLSERIQDTPRLQRARKAFYSAAS
jgi:hypothetical protein